MKRLTAGLACLVVVSGARLADAHVSIAGGQATANTNHKVTFSVGHGCEGGADTIALRIEIPAGITGVRAMRSDFAKPSIERDATTDAVTAVLWRKPAGELQEEDIEFYELTLRVRIPDAAFSQIAWTVHQTCRPAGGTEADETTVTWGGETAAILTVLPARQSGWNSYVVPEGLTIPGDSIPTYFGDAQIVWRGTAAYSPNAAVAQLIGSTAGVTALTGDLVAGDQLWVKY